MPADTSAPAEVVQGYLGPCPICGEQPKRNGRFRAGGVLCAGPNDGFPSHRVQTYGATQEEADEAWNERALNTRPVASTLDPETVEACAKVAAIIKSELGMTNRADEACMRAASKICLAARGIKPCPSCGGKPVVDAKRGRWMIFCPTDENHLGTGFFDSRAEAIAAWNTRPVTSTLDVEAVEACAKVADRYREEAGGSASYQQACRHIASTIRALSPGKTGSAGVGEGGDG